MPSGVGLDGAEIIFTLLNLNAQGSGYKWSTPCQVLLDEGS